MDTGERLWGMVTGYRVSGVAVVAGDFFERVPEGDLLVLKEVLSDWDDRQCVRIPRNCAEALRPGGRVVVVEPLLGAIGDEPEDAALNDLDTLLHLPGRGRGVPEFERLFRLAGLRRAEVVPTAGRFHVLEAVSRKVVRIQNNE